MTKPILPRSILSVALSGTLALLAAPAHAAPDPAATHRFEQVVHDFYERYLATHPEEATQLGDHRFDRKSIDASAAGVAADRKLYRKTLDVLQAIPASSLPPDHAVDREILVNDLRARLFDVEVMKTYTWQVTDYSGTEGVYVLLARDFAPIKDRLAAARLRLEAIPRLVAAAKQNLQRPPRVFTETAIAQNKGAISFVQDDLDDFIKQAPAMKAALAPARARAAAALKDYGVWLEKVLLPRSDGDFRFGKAHFEQRLQFSLDSDLSADEILARAEADLKATQAQMEQVALPLYKRWFPDKPVDGVDGHVIVRAVLDKIADTHPDNDTIVAEARDDLDKATAFVREHKLVSLPARPIKVIVMPEFQRGQATAFCDWAGPLDKNGETFYAISPTPADWSPQRVESQYREDNSAELRDITAHEAMSGHYLQGSHASQAKMPTLVRAMTGSGIFIEGAEMVVKFSREDAQEAAPLGEAGEFTVTGIVRYEWDFSCSFTGTDYLRVIEEGEVHTNEEDWSSILADAPRGDLANVRANGNGDMGPGTCLENFQSNYGFGVNLDPDVPPPGEAFIYLYKFCNGTPNCSYGENSNGQELHFSEGGCH